MRMRIVMAACATGLALGACGETLKLDVLQDELWWGGTVADGFQMPLCATNVYEKDLRVDSSGNEAAPLLLSTKGRWVWCEDAFKYTFRDGVLTVETGPAPHPSGRRPHPMEVTAAAANPMEVRDASVPAAEAPAAGVGSVRRTFAPIQTGVAAGGSLRAAFEHCSRAFFPPKGHPRLEFFRQPILNTWVELNYNQNEEDVLRYAQSFLDNGMKPGVLMIDCFWQTDAFGPWTFHAARFRDPKGMSDKLHAMGYRLMLWMAPFVTLDSMPYRYLRDNGGILVDARMERAGKGFQGYPVRWWDGMSAVWDPTSPTGRKWMTDTLRRIMTDYGVDGFFFDGAGPHEFPAGDYVAHDRTAEPTDLTRAFQMMALEVPFQQVREAWKMGGLPVMSTLRDKGPRWSEMRRCVTDMIAAGQLGYPFVVADLVGGGTCGNNGSGVYGLDWQDELFIRHLQIQCLSPMIQFSGSPWRLVSPAAQEIVRKMLKLRERFAPQIERMVVDCGKTGLPILRSMDFAFPHHGYERILNQFMLGDDLLVAPVVEGGVKTRTVVIPEGAWTADDGTVVTGPKTVTVATPLERLVYFTRGSACGENVVRIEVSPEGPCPSLTAARDAIRTRRAEGTLSGPVTVAVKPGRYAYAEPLVLTAQDGGTSEAPVRYVAEGNVTLDAGWTLPPGRPLEASVSGAAERIPAAVRSQVRQVDLSAFKAKDLDGCRLVGTDGTPYVRARYPNEGWMKFPKIEKEKGKGGRPFCLHIPFADDRVASWTDEPDVRGIGFPMHDWAPANWKVTQIDAAARTMELKGSGYGFRTGGRWYASHVLRELDVSGEYYVDRAARTLYYVPRPGDAEKGLSLAGAAGLVRAMGVANVSFEGFAFANAKECALEFVGCTNVSVTGGSVWNCGAGAVARESAKCRFEGIDAAHFEDRGFVLSGGEPLALVKSDNVIANCRIRDWGRAYNGYSGAVSMSGCGARLTGCDISQGAHGAVFFAGTEHLIESNEIHDVCLESGEMGAVYTGRNWSYVGNRIVGNHFHDLPKTCRQPTRAIMLDDGVGSIVIVSNRFERCAEGVCASGFANVIEDNLFVDCRPAVGLWAAWVLPDCFSTNIRNVARLIATLEKAPVDSPVWKERFPWTSLMRDAVRSGKLRDPLTRTRIRNNVFVTPGDEQIHWVRPRDKSPDGYLVEGNVTKRK